MEGVVRDKSATHGRAARKKGGHVPGQAGLVDSEIGHHAVSDADSRTGVPAQIRQHASQINWGNQKWNFRRSLLRLLLMRLLLLRFLSVNPPPPFFFFNPESLNFFNS